MDAEFTSGVGKHHNRLGRESVFNSPDRLAVDFVLPVRNHVTLDGDEVIERLDQLRCMGDIVAVEGYQACEMLNLLHRYEVGQVHDRLDLLWVGSSTCSRNQVAKYT